MWFSAWPRAVEPLIEVLGAATLQVGDDKAGISSRGTGLDPRNDALDPAPAAGGIVELREAPHLAARRCRGEAFGSGFLQRLDMAPQRCIGRQPQHPIDPVLSAPIEDLRAGVVRIGAQQDLDPRPEGADGADEAAQEGADLMATRPLARAQQRGDETPLAIEHDDRLEAVIVMESVEQA